MRNSILPISLIFIACFSCQNKSDNTTTGNPFVALAFTSSASNTTVVNSVANSIPNFVPNLQTRGFIDLLLPKAVAYPAPATLLDSAGNTVVIQSMWVNIEKIEFKQSEVADSSEVDSTDVEFQGPYPINLLSMAPAPMASGFISLNLLRRIKVKLAKVVTLQTGAPAGLLTKSIYISGTLNGQNFSYSTQDETIVEIAGPQLVVAIENSTLLLELQTANLIKKMNLSSISSTTHIDEGNRITVANPCPKIDASAADLFTCFRKGFETESNFGRDDDNDFQLDDGESRIK